MYQRSHDAENTVSFAYYSRLASKRCIYGSLSPRKIYVAHVKVFGESARKEKKDKEQLVKSIFKTKRQSEIQIDIKEKLKNRQNDKMLVASLDLQQVIYLPRSNRCKQFYKRRLSCYNFSILDIKFCEATCFVWNESITAIYIRKELSIQKFPY